MSPIALAGTMENHAQRSATVRTMDRATPRQGNVFVNEDGMVLIVTLHAAMEDMGLTAVRGVLHVYMGMAHVTHSWGHVYVQLGGEDLTVTALVPQVHGVLNVLMNVDAVMVQSATMKQGNVCVYQDGEVQIVHSLVPLEVLVMTAFKLATAVTMHHAVEMMAFANANLVGWVLVAHKLVQRVLLDASALMFVTVAQTTLYVIQLKAASAEMGLKVTCVTFPLQVQE